MTCIQKHSSIKFEYKISQLSIPLLDTVVYIKNNKLYTKIDRKEIDRPFFWHINSEHPASLKNSMPYSQVLRVLLRTQTKVHWERIQIWPSR